MNRIMKTTRPVAALVSERDWYRIKNTAAGVATIYIYGEIGWYVTAADFAAELRLLDVSSIEVHINSPGGDVFEGIAIMEALKQHPAAVSVIVDSLAASAASVIALGGDTLTMAPAAQYMIHEPYTMCYGDAADMRASALMLDSIADTLAGLYAAKAGGDVATWRAVMVEETWYSAEAAVAAGLADAILRAPAALAPAEMDTAASWDLSIFQRRPEPVAAKAEPEQVAVPEAPLFTYDPDVFRSALKEGGKP